MKRPATDDLKLCELYSFGNTNLVSRPTKDQAELSPSEMEDGVPVLEGKIRKWKPEAVCIVGKGIWERVYKVKAGKKLKSEEFRFGWQEGWKFGEDPEEGWEGARVFVAISTSGLVAGYSMQQKLEIMTELGDWVNERRHDRGETAPRGLPDEVVEKAAREREKSFRESLVEWEKQVKVEAESAGGVESEGRLEDGKVKIKAEDDGTER
jgi:G:T/U-mismatch repair DNA glycosylase